MTKTTWRRVPALTLALLGAGSQMLPADPTPVGSEFQVSTITTRDQSYPIPVLTVEGDFVIVWSGWTGGYPEGYGVLAKRYDRDGNPVGTELAVDPLATPYYTIIVGAGADADGNFVVVWEKDGVDGYGFGIAGQRYDRDGGEIGGVFQVNSFTSGRQGRPSMAMIPDGDFVVTWNSDGQDGSSWGQFGQRYGSSGEAVGSEFQINTITSGGQFAIDRSVAMSDRGFIAVWKGPWGGVDRLFARSFNSSGNPMSPEFLVNSITTGGHSYAKVAMASDFSFIVTWTYRYESEFEYDVLGHRFDSPFGIPVGSDFLVNTYTTLNQRRSAVAMEPDGAFIAVWDSVHQDGSWLGVIGQQFDRFGLRQGGEFQVNTYTTDHQEAPAVAVDAAGNFLVVWHSYVQGEHRISAQRFRSPCGISYPLTAWQWKMISLPCDPGAANTVAAVFGDDLNGTYGWDWVVYERAGATYNKLLLTDPLEMGVGYWLQTALSGEVVEVDGLSPYVADVALSSSATGVQNLVGHPFDFDVCWAHVRVIDGSSVLTLDEADPAGECEKPSPGPTCVMSRIMNKWTGAAYAPYDGTTPGAEGTLGAFDGFWVKAFKPGIALRIPTRASESCDGTKSLARQAGKSDAWAGGWYVRLIAEAGGLHDRDSVFGQLPESADGYDAHDLPELPPFSQPYLTVVFPHPEWKDRAGDYATDYHARKRRRDSWRVAVRASSGVGPVRLRWEGPRGRLRRMQLRDERSGKTMWMLPGRSYTFEVTGGERIFTVKTQPG